MLTEPTRPPLNGPLTGDPPVPDAPPRSRPREAVLFGGIALLSGVAPAAMQVPWLLLLVPPVLLCGAALFLWLDVGVAALAFITYTNLSEVLFDRHGVPSIARTLVGVLAALAALRWLAGYDRFTIPWGPIALVGTYAGVQLVSSLSADHGDLALQAALTCVKDALVGLIAVALLRRADGLRLAIWAMLAGGGLIAALSTFQVLTDDYSTDFGGLAKAAVHQIVGEVANYRITGPLDDPNFYAQTLVALVPLAFDRMMGRETPLFRLLAGGILAALVAAILLTYSRGGLLALVCVMLAAVAFLRPSLRVALPVVLLVGATLPFLPDSYADRMQTMVSSLGESRESDGDESVEGRLNEAKAALSMFADHPFLGIGAKNYGPHFQQYNAWQHGENRREDREAHSLYLEVAADTGLAGIAAFGLILVSLARSITGGVRRFRAAGLTDGVGMGRSLGLALVGYGIAAVWLHSAWPQYFWLLAGLAWALPAIARQAAAEREATAFGQDGAAEGGSTNGGNGSSGGPSAALPDHRNMDGPG